MRVGIDYTSAVWQGAGIGRYTRELVRATIEAGGAFQYVLFYAAHGLDERRHFVSELQQLCAEHANVRARPIPLSPRRLTQLWQRLRVPLPVELFTGPLDLVHAPDFVVPPTRARSLVTVHDLSFLIYPQFAVPSMVRYLSSAVPRSIRRASLVLADSEATRQDMLRLLHVPAEKMTVVYPGVSSAFRPLPAALCEPVRARLGLPQSFLLFVSTLNPRKNVVRLVEAFAQLTRDGAWPDLKLVLAGSRGWLYEDIFATIDRLGLKQRIVLLDFVDDNDLPALYNLAQACVYPSLYEGFGLPALEALACGTPLVTANNSSLPEIASGAAVLVEAEDVAAIAAGVASLLADSPLRQQFREAGMQRAKQFTWQHAAQQVLAAYQSLQR